VTGMTLENTLRNLLAKNQCEWIEMRWSCVNRGVRPRPWLVVDDANSDAVGR